MSLSVCLSVCPPENFNCHMGSTGLNLGPNSTKSHMMIHKVSEQAPSEDWTQKVKGQCQSHRFMKNTYLGLTPFKSEIERWDQVHCIPRRPARVIVHDR